MALARCPYCGRWYAIHPRLWGRQKTCGDPECRAKHKAALNRQWWADHPEKQQARYAAVLERRRRERYWNKRRDKYPEYVQRNREQTKVRMRRLRARRKAVAEVLHDPVKYLEGLGAGCEEMFATQESIGAAARRGKGSRPTMFATQEPIAALAVGMWKYLQAQVMFATPEGVAQQGRIAVQSEQ